MEMMGIYFSSEENRGKGEGQSEKKVPLEGSSLVSKKRSKINGWESGNLIDEEKTGDRACLPRER